MEFSGLILNHPSKRLLTEKERAYQLKQRERLNVEPHYQLSVIKLNSTYLESVDKWFAWKGAITAVTAALFLIFVGGGGRMSLMWFLDAAGVTSSPEDVYVSLANGLAMAVVVALIGWCITWLLRKESFAFTHYPVRFNRKTRMVHVFRTNGTVLSVPWDDVFFTMEHMAQWDEWEVRGHVLEPDSTTVRESFALSYLGSLNPSDAQPNRTQFSAQDFVHAHWEFIRRYMEDGPQSVSGQVQFCMPVDTQRESMQVSVQRLFANITGAPIVLFLMLLPFCLVISLFRLFAMRTSRVPHWPTEIDAVCAIESNDPYAIEGNPSADRVAVFPEAAKAAGVGFVAPPGAMARDLRKGLAKKGADNGAANGKVK
jgi:hypothetical protein